MNIIIIITIMASSDHKASPNKPASNKTLKHDSSYLFILARHDVRHTQVSQNDRAHVEDLWGKEQERHGCLLGQRMRMDKTWSYGIHMDTASFQHHTERPMQSNGSHASTHFTDGFLWQGHSWMLHCSS